MAGSRRVFLGQLAAGTTIAGAVGSAELAAATPVAELGPGRAPDDERYWHWIADQFLTQPDVAHMNTGTRGVSPRQVIKAQFDAIRGYDSDYISYATYVNTVESRAAIRAKLAGFVGCRPNEVAITNNTTEGMAFGTLGLDFKRGDEIIYTNHDHSGGAQPIRLCAARYGVTPVVVDLSDPKFHPPREAAMVVEAVERAITPRTRLISFCHVNYTDGCVMPVREICQLARSRGILTLIDGAHPPGMLDLNIADLGCDMYAGAGHKWLLASMLTGLFYVREEVQDRVWPVIYSGPVAGRNMYDETVPDNAYYAQADNAARYEMRGSHHFAKEASLDAALDFHGAISPAAIEARVRDLARRTREGLRRIPGVSVHVSDDESMSCALVSFNVRGVATQELNDLLWLRHRIYIRNVTHPEIDWDVNRASLHIMVHAGQVETLIGAVEEIARERRA